MVHPVVAEGFSGANMFRGEHRPSGDQSPVSFGNSPTEEDMLSKKHKAIVVGVVGTGTPWFLTGWAGGTEGEFIIDTGC